MVRERRKSFYLATQRISDYSNSLNLSQSTIVEADNSKKSSSQPTRSSKRVNYSSLPIISSSAPKKRKSSSNQSKHAANSKKRRNENDTNELPTDNSIHIDPFARFSAEWPKIRLNRMSVEFLKQQLSGSQSKSQSHARSQSQSNSQSQFQSQSQSTPVDKVTAKKIVARRCAVSLFREDFSHIDENGNRIEHRSTLVPQPLQIESEVNLPNDSISNDDGILPHDSQDDLSTFYESERMDKTNADSEEDAPTQLTTQCSQDIRQPIITQQFRMSQTNNYIPWLLNRESSLNTEENSTTVQFRRSPKTIPNETGIVEKKKCFIDSSNVSYGQFIEYKPSKFSVNCFDHGDASIQHHFLSKFDRNHFPALGIFDRDLWVSEITGRLIKEYSRKNVDRIHILKYNEPVEIDNVTVTAIEVPKFPGGALFLFEGKDEKTIIHAGDFRLPTELESHELLINNTNIDKIQFDTSILSQLFYQYPPCTDRYLDLHNEIYEFIQQSRSNGLHFLIAVGAFEIGMEHFIYELANNFGYKVYMDSERRAFLRTMDSESDTTIEKLRNLVVDDPNHAQIHILKVDEISYGFLTRYINKFQFITVLGIRPRGCDIVLQTVVDGGPHKIVDTANPLIGDIEEYERFVKMTVSKNRSETSSGGHNQLV